MKAGTATLLTPETNTEKGKTWPLASNKRYSDGRPPRLCCELHRSSFPHPSRCAVWPMGARCLEKVDPVERKNDEPLEQYPSGFRNSSFVTLGLLFSRLPLVLISLTVVRNPPCQEWFDLNCPWVRLLCCV